MIKKEDLIDYKIRIYKAKIRYNKYSNQRTQDKIKDNKKCEVYQND